MALDKIIVGEIAQCNLCGNRRKIKVQRRDERSNNAAFFPGFLVCEGCFCKENPNCLQL